VQHLITQYGYLAVFVLMLAESACIPVPSEVIMMFGGALAAGAFPGAHPSLAGIFAADVLGNVAGSYLAWAVGKYAGQAAIRRWGRRVGVREHEIDKAMAWFERHGPVAVLVGRCVPVIRTFISLPAGFAEMSPGLFGLYTALGAIPWTAALAIGGYALGANWEHVANDFHGPTYAIAGLLVVAVVVLLVRRRRKNAAMDAAGAPRASTASAGGAAPAGRAGYPGNAAYAGPGAHPGDGGYPPRDQRDQHDQGDQRGQQGQRGQQDPWEQGDPWRQPEGARGQHPGDPRGGQPGDPGGQQGDPWSEAAGPWSQPPAVSRTAGQPAGGRGPGGRVLRTADVLGGLAGQELT
jgi:membrane protein DedA with SNARE-associated domain